MKLSTITLIKILALISCIFFAGCGNDSENSQSEVYEYIDEGENLNDQAMINRLTISAQNFIDQGDLDNAVEVLSRLILISPDNVDAYYKRANVKRKLGLLEESIGDYTRALDLDPSLVDAYLRRGVSHAN